MKASIVTLFQNAIGSVRNGSKMSHAMGLYVQEINSPSSDKSHRQRCVSAFKSHLNMVDTTASTYYDLCSKQFLEQAEQQNEQIAAGKHARVYTAFRVKPGTNIIAQRVVLTKQSETEQIATGFGMTGVVKGVVALGAQAPV